MSKNWDYANFSKLAKLHGGPAEFVKKIYIAGYNAHRQAPLYKKVFDTFRTIFK